MEEHYDTEGIQGILHRPEQRPVDIGSVPGADALGMNPQTAARIRAYLDLEAALMDRRSGGAVVDG